MVRVPGVVGVESSSPTGKAVVDVGSSVFVDRAAGITAPSFTLTKA
jgi:hypothetical protein